jgi:ubiquinone/menaquinone biosynthesis C-methylase UbiE
MNQALKRMNDEYAMLHFPYYINENDSFLQAQMNLTDFLISLLGSLDGKKILEVGCGNGVQAMYIKEKFKPAVITGIDLDEGNINIATSEMARRQLENISFFVSNAQNMTAIDDQSIDIVINVESALHYPDKTMFLKEIYRVLRPGGSFLVADVLTTKNKGFGLRWFWKKRMNQFHWHKQEYDRAFPEAKLTVTHVEEITNNVIKGFRSYKRWIREIKRVNIFSDWAFRLFYIINVYWNIFVLQYRREYYVFVGIKPE